MFYIVSPFENHIESRGTRNLSLYNKIKNHSECEIVTSNFSHQEKRSCCIDKFKNSPYRYKVIKVLPYKTNLSLFRFVTHQMFAVKLFLYLIFRVNKNDTVVVSSIPPEMVFLLSILKFVKGFNLHLDVRDIWPNALPIRGWKKVLFSLYCGFLYSLSNKLTDTVSYVSPSFKTLWLDKYVPDVDSRLIPLGYDEKRWSKKEYVDNGAVIKLIYIGYLQSQFSLVEIINAVNSRNDFSLLVVGDGEKRRDYERLASDKITFLGSQPLDKAAELVGSSDVGVLPISGDAQMPNKFFDYCGANIPILSIGDSDSSKYIIEKDIGWVSSFDNKTLHDSLNIIQKTLNQKFFNMCKVRTTLSKEKLYEDYINLIIGENNND